MIMEKIYYNGSIITMESQDDCFEALVEKDGIIVKLTDFETARKEYPSAELKNLEGKTLMPSFIDPHGHISLTMQLVTKANLGDCETNEQIIETLKKYIEDNKIEPGTVVMGYNYDHNVLPDYKHPDKYVLDKASTEHPIIILHASVHMCVCNSLMLKASGYTDDEKNPDGGCLGRIEETGELSGYLEETAMNKAFWNLRGVMDDFDKCIHEAQKLYLSNGVTTVQDGAASRRDVESILTAGKDGKLCIDVVSYPVIGEGVEDIFADYPECDEKYSNHFKLGGYKLVLDGSPQGCSAFLSKPYEGRGDYRGYPRFADEQVNEYVKKAIDDDRQLLTHCNGDAAGDQLLAAYKKALKESENSDKDNLRPVMIHCQTAREDQLDVMADINMIASIFVGHVYYWGDVHVKNLGVERGSRVSPVASALKRGISVNFHQDTPVTLPKMFHSVWAAVNRKTRSGKIIGSEQCVDVYDALKAVTINAAYEYFEENEKGSLKAGKRADMIICDKNPLKVEKDEIKDITVLETIKDGKTLYKK